MTPKMLAVVIPGSPQAKERARAGSTRRFFTPKKTRDWQKHVGLMLLSVRPDGWPMDARYALAIVARHEGRQPDLSNIVKGIEDAGNGVVYNDDRQIVQYDQSWLQRADKGVDPYVYVALRVVEPQEGGGWK